MKRTKKYMGLMVGALLVSQAYVAQAQSAIANLEWKDPKIVMAGSGVSTPDFNAITADAIKGSQLSSGKEEVSTIRMQAVQEAAASLGARAGLARGLSDIDASLKKVQPQLDRLYRFSALTLSVPVNPGLPATAPNPKTGNGEYVMILPPVLLEGNDSDSLPNEEEIRIADRVYKNYAKARLVPVDKQTGRPAVPDWRDYLVFAFQEVQMPHVSLLPRNEIEKKIWNEWVQKGWTEGMAQAQQMFEGGWARLNRDFNGMLNYRLAYSQGLETRPKVAGVNMGVTGGGNEMRLNDRVVRITDHSALVPDTTKWTTNQPK